MLLNRVRSAIKLKMPQMGQLLYFSEKAAKNKEKSKEEKAEKHDDAGEKDKKADDAKAKSKKVAEPAKPLSEWTQEPVRVSPLIKLSRWVLLIWGIIYGAARNHELSEKEQEVREREAELKIIRDAQLAQEKRERALNEAKALDMLSKPVK